MSLCISVSSRWAWCQPSPLSSLLVYLEQHCPLLWPAWCLLPKSSRYTHQHTHSPDWLYCGNEMGYDRASTQLVASRAVTSAPRHRILNEALLRSSLALVGRKNYCITTTLTCLVTPSSLATSTHTKKDCAPSCPENQQPPPPHPFFSRAILIVGDSLITNIFGTATRCFPGATIPDIMDKLPGLLYSLLSSTKRIIINMGTKMMQLVNSLSWPKMILTTFLTF